IFRLRSLLYMGVWSAVGIGLVVALLARDRLEVNVLHDRNPQYVLESNGDIRNGYSVKILNMIAEPRVIFLSIEGLPGATMRIPGIDQPAGVSFAVEVEPDRLRELKVHVLQPKEFINSSSSTFRIIAEDKASTERDVYVANFHAPETN
ncbi:MAG: FixG Ig-like domain-containing protein, partial [Hoeflea sp.]